MQYCKIFRKSKFKDTGQQYSKIGIVKIRNGKLEIPQPDTTITRGEKVAVLVKRGSFKKLAKKLG